MISISLQHEISQVNWRAVKLGEVLTLINGRAYKKEEERDVGTPVLRIQNLNGGDRWFYSDLALPSDKYCDKGDLLFAWSATFGPYIWWGEKVIYHYHIWKIECGPALDKRFAYYLLQNITERVKAAGRGISMIHMTKGGMEEWEVSIPPLEEQKRIAAILDQADELRRLRQKSLDRLNTLCQAIFFEMFASGASVNWPMMPVSEIINREKGGIRTGPFGSQLLHSEFVDSGIAVLGIDNAVSNEFRWNERRYITPQKYAQLKRYTVFPDDVIITIMGTCGRCAIVPKDIPTSINTKHLCCISLDQKRCLSDYLHSYFLMHPVANEYLRSKAKGAIMDGLNMGLIKEMPVVLPPIELQLQYQKISTELNAKKLLNGKSSDLLEALFTSLQHRAFRGEL